MTPQTTTSKILVLGATGYLGRAIVDHLLEAGHDVVALLKPGASAAGLPRRVETRTGDLADPAALRAAVTEDIDGVVHLVPPTGDEAVDRAAIEVLIDSLLPGRALVYTSGVWVLGPTAGTLADEATVPAPLEIVRYRPGLEAQVIAAASVGVRSVVIRPGVVHGRDGGIPGLLVALAKEHGTGIHIGGVPARWPMVHVDDLADLYVLAVDRAPAGRILHGISEHGVDTRDLARAAASAAQVDGTSPWPASEAGAALGHDFVEALMCDQTVSADLTGALLGWQPRRLGAVADLSTGSDLVGASAH